MDILGSIANGAVGGLLGGIGTLAKDIREAITGEISADKQAELAQKTMEIELAAATGQMQINLEEAKSEHLFVAGFRPAANRSLLYTGVTQRLVGGRPNRAFPCLCKTVGKNHCLAR